MSLDKLEAIIEKEIVNRKVYEDAALAVKELKGFRQSVESAKAELKKLSAEKESLLSSVESLQVKKAQMEKEAAYLVEKAKAEANALKQAAKDVCATLEAQSKEKMASMEAAVKEAAEELKKTNDAVALAKADLKDAKEKKDQLLKSLSA